MPIREIKFRAWDGKKMLQGQSVMNFSLAPLLTWSDRVMQFTGLKDKNGKEIYEGDIIKRWNGGYGPIEYRGGSFVVVFDDPEKAGYCETLKTYLYPREGEVIGNIYENPELIK